MATIAKGMITLVNVNDAYSVSATPNVCAIKADFDGTNPVLTDAHCDITVVRGDVKVPFRVVSSTPSNERVSYTIEGTDEIKRLALTDIPADVLSGTVTVEIATEDEFVATVIFQYSVMRESTMLDWIKDWENNKTTVGSTYLITPKIFVGKKVTTENDLSVLTGVYIGPDSEKGAGIYGYKEGVDIFHINETGALIGGWEINNGGIQTTDGTLKLLSSGSIISSDSDGNVNWALNKNGSAEFASGRVRFSANGDAVFQGTIRSSEGNIAGWEITENFIWSGGIALHSGKNGTDAMISVTPAAYDNLYDESAKTIGGIELFYNNSNNYGIVGYLPMINTIDNEVRIAFSLGAVNRIAGWEFDDVALWTGTKNNTAHQYTIGENNITIGTNGLRGNKWYIDTNGDISFMGGKIKFSAIDDGGEIVGWKLNNNRFSTNNVALISDGSLTGLYMSAASNAAFNSIASSSLENFIDTNGGIYMNINNTGAEFAAYNKNGKKLFKLKSDDVSTIAGWNFNSALLYTGTPIALYDEFTKDANSISISPLGIFGYKWRLGMFGDGAVAGGNISWDENGNVTFAESVKIGWSNLGGTIINSEGVFAGKISADNITAGTISTADIKNAEGTWYLKQNGSGQLANGNISWDESGNTHVKGLFSQELVKIYQSDAIVTTQIENRFTLKLNKNLYLVTQFSDLDYESTYEQYEIPSNEYFTLILPDDPYYIGKEVKIYDCNFGPYTRTSFSFRETRIQAESFGIAGLPPLYATTVLEISSWDSIEIMGGYIQLVGLPEYKYDENNNATLCTRWLCIAYNGNQVFGIKNNTIYQLAMNFENVINEE